MGQSNRAQVHLAEACQLIHLVRMRHQTDGDEVDFVEGELFRRIFWHVYAVDM